LAATRGRFSPEVRRKARGGALVTASPLRRRLCAALPTARVISRNVVPSLKKPELARFMLVA